MDPLTRLQDLPAPDHAMRALACAVIEAASTSRPPAENRRRVLQILNDGFRGARPRRHSRLVRATYWRVLNHVSRQLHSFDLRLWGWLSYF